jgi:hypothetical protein
LIDLTIRHWNAALQVFRYLKGTIDYRLVFNLGASNATLINYTSADYTSA